MLTENPAPATCKKFKSTDPGEITVQLYYCYDQDCRGNPLSDECIIGDGLGCGWRCTSMVYSEHTCTMYGRYIVFPGHLMAGNPGVYLARRLMMRSKHRDGDTVLAAYTHAYCHSATN